MRKINKMHLYLINLFQLDYPVHVPNKQVIIWRSFLYTQHAVSPSHTSMECLAANTIRLELFQSYRVSGL
jgi:hypothetical protein